MENAQQPRTLADYFEATKVKVTGAPDLMLARRERMKALVIDGHLLGDYELEAQRNKEAAKRFVELQWLGIVLVGCGVDREIRELRSLPPPAADFEATLHNGEVVRIELARLVDQDEKRYLSAIGSITEGAQRILDQRTSARSGSFVLRFHGGDPPQPQDIDSAATELAEFIATDQRFTVCSTTLWSAGKRFATLYRLGAHVAHLNDDGPLNLTVDPSPTMANQKATAATFAPLVAQKKAKFAEYSQGHPVWLALCVDTRLFYPIGVVQQLAGLDSFDPRPFERIIVGCPTLGLIFDAPNQKPRSLGLTAH